MNPNENEQGTVWVGEMFSYLLEREKTKVEITTESPLLTWLVRHCGWILWRHAVGADGMTGYWRLKEREFSAGIAIFGEAIWYKLPKVADLTKLENTSLEWTLEQSWNNQ